jgi:hypothetical protein
LQEQVLHPSVARKVLPDGCRTPPYVHPPDAPPEPAADCPPLPPDGEAPDAPELPAAPPRAPVAARPPDADPPDEGVRPPSPELPDGPSLGVPPSTTTRGTSSDEHDAAPTATIAAMARADSGGAVRRMRTSLNLHDATKCAAKAAPSLRVRDFPAA